VYAHRLPSRDNAYIMLVVRQSTQGPHKQGVYLSWSPDARRWSPPQLIIGRLEDGSSAWSPCLFHLQDRYFVAYHSDIAASAADPKPHTDIRVDEFDADFTVRKPLGFMLEHRLFGEDNTRVADPQVILEGATVYLAVAIGDRLKQRIALAKADVADLERALGCAG
jgi:hypothetical protein